MKAPTPKSIPNRITQVMRHRRVAVQAPHAVLDHRRAPESGRRQPLSRSGSGLSGAFLQLAAAFSPVWGAVEGAVGGGVLNTVQIVQTVHLGDHSGGGEDGAAL